MVNPRLSPEQLLHRVEQEQLKEGRGKLKIYLGAAPGVGKTHAMLHDAIEKRSKGLDVLVGVAESHGREDIDFLLQDLEKLPRLDVDYRGTTCKEFDLDAALQRHPALILVDEMAHTNAPGLRHEKRWQDIKELLDKGIDVYTTLNVQHIESLKDDIARIIQAPIKESVPDSMIEMADTIELIDLPPEELLKRLQDGKIYYPAQADLAKEHFFRRGNLIALRELALRITAERVGTDVLLYRQDEGIKKIWPVQDKILVCVGPRPESRSLIRSAKRIASSLQAEWMAVYVDRPHVRSSVQIRNAAIENLRLAELLGAETHILTGFDIVKEVMNFATDQNVTQIMIWKHNLTRWQSFFVRNLSDELVRQSGDIDVYIKTGEKTTSSIEKTPGPKSSTLKAYAIAFGMVSMATFINYFLSPLATPSSLVIIYLLGVVLTALLGHMGPAVFALILSVFAYDFFFITPSHSFALPNVSHFVALMVMLVVGQTISYLTIFGRRQSDSLRMTQKQTQALYTLNRQLNSTHGINNLLDLGTNYIAKVFDSEVVAFVPKKNRLKMHQSTPPKPELSVKEQSIAQWVYDMNQAAGLGTDTLAFSKAIYLPLAASSGPIGVVRVEPKEQQLLSPEQMKLLESCVNQLALSVAVARLQEKESREHLQIETDRARTSLLRAIFHDLCFPLKRVITALNSLKKIEGAKLRIIEQNIDLEVEKLNRLNNDLYLIIQLETEELQLAKMHCSLKKIINAVLKVCQESLKDRTINMNIPEDMPSILLDNKLIQQVFIHLFDNAVKFSPPKTPINIFVHTEHRKAVITIEDYGSGIPFEEKHKVFEKFYRGKHVITEQGLGLGLAICQKIIKAHNGQIWVESIESKGAIFRFTLPMLKEHYMEQEHDDESI